MKPSEDVVSNLANFLSTLQFKLPSFLHMSASKPNKKQQKTIDLMFTSSTSGDFCEYKLILS